jgi:glutamate synthase domain-containing protein 2
LLKGFIYYVNGLVDTHGGICIYSKVGGSLVVGATNRTKDDVNAISGLCGTCVESCIGLCEVGRSAVRGPEIIYPMPFGDVTAAAIKKYPVDWGDFNILGTAKGAYGVEPDSNKAAFPSVKIEVTLGNKNGHEGIKLKLPITIPGLGSTDVARKQWDSLATAAALTGVLSSVGENVVGMDPLATFSNGKVVSSPALDSRINAYKKAQRGGYGAIVVQENVEDNRLGVLEYALSKGVDGVEIKWGQGAKNIGGEVKIHDLKKAQLLKERGYIVLPDPTDPNVIEAFQRKAFREFERHSRLGMVTEEGFANRVKQLRDAGAKYIFLKTGAYRFEDLARAVAYCSIYKVDVLTVDAAGGGTGMSPWRMMNEWGTPPIETFQKTFEYCQRLDSKGKYLPDIVFAGGFALEDHLFKGLALGAPYVKAIGMARAPLTAAMASSALWRRIDTESDQILIDKYGRDKSEIFYGANKLKNLVGDKFDEIPAGALGVYTYFMRVEQGLKQLMAGARKFDVFRDNTRPNRNDIVALTKEASSITGIPYIMDHDKEKVDEILSKV